MPERTTDSDHPDFQLFEQHSFLGLEGVLRLIHPPLLDSRMQVVVAVLVTWLPLVILAAFQNMAIGRSRAESFLADAGVQARFLIALPVVLVYSGRVSTELHAMVEHFLNARLITESQRERFMGNLNLVMKLGHSRLAEGIILASVYVVQAFLILALVSSRLPPSWRILGAEGHRLPSLAGLWFAAISEPIYGFVFCRFLYRIGLWWMFLWKTSQLDLQLDGAHPDLAGGIGFLGMTLDRFKEVAFAISTSFAGGLANVVLLTGAEVSRYKFEILFLVALTVALFAGPLFFFYGLLVGTRFRDTLRYWALWQGLQRQFEQKWLRHRPVEPDMLGVQDFSEATDLSQILERVQQMGVVPFRRRQLWPLLLAAALPFLAVLTMDVPLEEMIKRLAKIAF
jgi:hypothetical protein